jgi:hypothetical protein
MDNDHQHRISQRTSAAKIAVAVAYLPHHMLARPRLAPDVGKAEEGE